jgi:GNAT superfamily N-acetyltransferase
MPIVIREARPDDAPELRMIEIAAGEQFRDIGLPNVADHEPPSKAAYVRFATTGRSWVASDDAGRLVGYVLVDDVDGNAYIEQVSVRPDHQGSGVGRALIDRVAAWAAATGRPAMTLLTFKDVPWNAPLYRHLEFRMLSDAEIGPQLRAIRDGEAMRGLDPAMRVCMRKEVAQ